MVRHHQIPAERGKGSVWVGEWLLKIYGIKLYSKFPILTKRMEGEIVGPSAQNP